MPELPEVETVLRGVAPAVVGRVVTRVILRERRLRAPVPSTLRAAATGKTILSAGRRGKWLIFRWDGGGLLAHLGMSGSLRVGGAPPREQHEHLGFQLDGGAYLIYRDPRRFGRVENFRGDESVHPLLRGLGPEPLEGRFNGAVLRRGLAGRDVAIKTALMDGRAVAGVGNIYACEALFGCGTHPQTTAGTLDEARCRALATALRRTLRASIRAGGSTIRDFVNGEGKPGWFQRKWNVYGREGLPCRRCGTTIRRVTTGGRSSFFCPGCQPRRPGGRR